MGNPSLFQGHHKEYTSDAETVRPDWRTVLMVTLEKGGIAHISRAFAASTDQVRPLIIDGHNPKDYKPDYPSPFFGAGAKISFVII